MAGAAPKIAEAAVVTGEGLRAAVEAMQVCRMKRGQHVIKTFRYIGLLLQVSSNTLSPHRYKPSEKFIVQNASICLMINENI